MKKKEEQEAKKIIDSILKTLGVETEYELTSDTDGIDIVFNTEEKGILIGYHGEVLEALQLIFSLAISKSLGRFVRVSLEIGDYKKARTEYLTNLIEEMREKVLADQKEYPVYNLKPWERRIIHVILQEDKELVSESVGEGRERTLVIKPR